MPDDYQRIAMAIGFIRENAGLQPTLAEIADHVHLSEYHFQRLFTRWAGVTPKRYLQVLTLDRAKTVLGSQKMTALNTSYEVGLSSASRLYDHFVQIEAVTPSEFKLKGLGLDIEYGFHSSPFGHVFIAVTGRGVCQLDFVNASDYAAPLQVLKANWCNANIMENPSKTSKAVNAIFNNTGLNTPVSLWVRGTNFQLNVWRALLNIPLGTVTSYGDIACQIGIPKASRAVGAAVGANPVALIIPCHRVLRQSGELGGYRWGALRKHAILAREAAQFD